MAETVQRLLNEFGKFFREQRLSLNKSQYCVAVELKLNSHQFISDIERGRLSLPFKKVELAAKALEIDRILIEDKLMEIIVAKARVRGSA